MSVKDYARTRDFYGDLLGMTIEDYGDGRQSRSMALDVGMASESTRLTRPTTRPPQKAGQNPATVNPRFHRAESHPACGSVTFP